MKVYTLPKRLHPDFSTPGRKPVGPVEIDPAHPLAPDTFFNLGGSNVDLVNSQPMARTTAGTGLSYPAANGEKVTRNGTTDQGLALAKPFRFEYQTGGWTVQFKAQKLAAASNLQGMIFGTAGFGTGTSYIWVYSTGLIFQNTGGSTAVFSTGYSENALATRTLVSDGAGNIDSYIDGIWQETIAWPDQFSVYQFLDGFSVNNYAFAGDVYYAYIKRAPLNAGQVYSLYQDPYQILKPAIPMQYAVPEAAPPSGFNPYWARNSNIILGSH